MNYTTNIRGRQQLRELSLKNENFASDAAIALSKLAEVVIKADGTQAFTGNQSMAGFVLTQLGAPVDNSDAVNKQFTLEKHRSHFVDAVAKNNITTLEGLITVDNYQLKTGDLILLTAQTNAIHNGIYTVNASSWTRHESLAVGSKANSYFVFVNNGDEFGASAFVSTTPRAANVVGTDPLSFRQFSTSELGVFNAPIKILGASDPANSFQIFNGDESSQSISVYYNTDITDKFVFDSSKNITFDINDKSGNFGINQSDPLFTLDVGGDINFEGTLYKNGVDIGDSFTNFEGFANEFSASDGQRAFQVTQLLFNSNPNYLIVTKNGVQLPTSSYVVTKPIDGNHIVTLIEEEACDSGDLIEIRPFNLSTVISSLELEAGNLIVPNEIQVGENSVHITDSSIIGIDPNLVNGETVNIDIVNGNANFKGRVTAENITINGDLSVTGSVLESLRVTDYKITLNRDYVGTPPTTLKSGLEIERGTAENYYMYFRESDQTFVIGELATLQAVATREDAPQTDGIMHWDAANKRMQTKASCYIDSSGHLYATKVYNAVWNDIAECMPSDGSLHPGDLAQVDLTTEDGYFRLTKFKGDFDAYIGVVSEEPGMIVGENESYENKVYIALKGMVYTSSLGIFPKGVKLYLCEDGSIKERKQIADFNNSIFIGTVIETHLNKIKIFI